MSNAEIEERTETKSKISCTAFQLFCQRGIKSVSMDDIAQFLSMSKKTIYKWFDNKNEIVVASTGAYLQDMQDRCEIHFQRAGNAIEELFNMMAMTRELLTSFTLPFSTTCRNITLKLLSSGCSTAMSTCL